MGKPTGFMDYDRRVGETASPLERLQNFNEFHEPLPEMRRREQGARCMDCGVPFCQSGVQLNGMYTGCPLNNLIPEWNDLIYTGNWMTAYNRLQKTNSFPEFTGRVCPALCEAACVNNLREEPTTVKDNELAVIEQAFSTGLIQPAPPKPRTGKRVAVVGSGPSGLAAADRLNKRGHAVTVYERFDRVGGLLMYGIPNMKLDKKIVNRRVELMREEGVEFVTGADVGRNVSADEIRGQYDCVILACGASNPRDIQAPGREANGIHFAVDYLRANTKSLLDSGLTDGKNISAKDKNVMVIGGGDTGNDCVGTAIRQGCRSLIQLEMMPQPSPVRLPDNPWPEWPNVLKTDYGQEEAIALFGHDPRVYQTTVKEFIPDEAGNLKQVVITHLKPVKDKKTGRTNMVPVEGSEETLDIELVLIAAGFLGSQSYVVQAFGVDTNPRSNVLTAPGGFATSVPGVFTAGDMHRGQSLVVWGIREGRDCARAVDEYLMGYSNL